MMHCANVASQSQPICVDAAAFMFGLRQLHFNFPGKRERKDGRKLASHFLAFYAKAILHPGDRMDSLKR